MYQRILISTIALIISGLVFNSCEKKTKTCSYNVEYFDYGFAFKNFLPSQIDTLVLKKYAAGSNFQTFISTDTLFVYEDSFKIVNNIIVKKQTPDPAKNYFFRIEKGADYRLVIPSVMDSFAITNVNDDILTYTEEGKEQCYPGNGSLMFWPLNSTFKLLAGNTVKIKLRVGISGASNDWMALIERN